MTSADRARAKWLAVLTHEWQTDDDLEFIDARNQKGLAALVRDGIAETSKVSRRDRFGRLKIRRVWRLTALP